MLKNNKLKPRIVLIEDDPARIEIFRAWLEDSPFVLLCATSGGQALGLINCGAEGVAGICLDHDLNTAPKTSSDAVTSGTQVVLAILNKVKRSVPVLIHTMSTIQGDRMFTRLQAAGFNATRIKMAALDEVRFKKWLEDVIGSWDFEEE